MLDDTGYIKLWRTLRGDWKWENPVQLRAWLWMLLAAEWGKHNPETGLARGQLYFSLRWAPTAWGMSHESARKFLKACENDKSISWSRSHGGSLSERGKNSSNSLTAKIASWLTAQNAVNLTAQRGGILSMPLTVPGIITIQKYEKWQSSTTQPLTAQNAVKDAVNLTAQNDDPLTAELTAPLTVSSLAMKKKKRNKNISPENSGDVQRSEIKDEKPEKPKKKKSDPNPSPNSLAYNHFVDLFREAQELPEWKPLKNQAIMMRANIKQSLENGITEAVFHECIEGYFQDDYARQRGFPWELFARNPLRYREVDFNDDRYWEDNL